jgi:trans-aconitate methyltransferase
MPDPDAVLQTQVAYYRERAADYLDQARRVEGFDELGEALLAFQPSGHVLELACGPGTWTPMLLRTAATITAVDAAPEMLDRARRRVGDAAVRFVQADVFSWRPDRRYDTVFFGFWLSHVPPDHFDEFWRLVQDCLVPGGRVFFMDDALRTTEEIQSNPSSSIIVRRTAEGSEHRLVKVAYTAGQLQERLTDLGWQFVVQQIAGTGRLYWASGGRAA